MEEEYKCKDRMKPKSEDSTESRDNNSRCKGALDVVDSECYECGSAEIIPSECLPIRKRYLKRRRRSSLMYEEKQNKTSKGMGECETVSKWINSTSFSMNNARNVSSRWRCPFMAN